MDFNHLDIVNIHEQSGVEIEKPKMFDEMKEIADTKPGFIRAMWCGDRACEDKLKEVAGVTSRCIPFAQEKLGQTCVCCGKPAEKMIYWGVAY